MGRNAPSRTPGGAVGTLCHAYGDRNQRRAAVDRAPSLDQGLLVVRLRDGQCAHALRRAAGGWTQPPTRTLPESSWGAAGARRGRCAQRPSAPDGAEQRSPCGPATQLFRPRATQFIRQGQQVSDTWPGYYGWAIHCMNSMWHCCIQPHAGCRTSTARMPWSSAL